MRETIAYQDGSHYLEGYLTAPDSATKLPGVIVAPSWLNVNESVRKRADRLAELGYAAFVLDVFGAGVLPRPPEQPEDVIRPFMEDRSLYRTRLLAGLETFLNHSICDETRVAAIGYCFGGCAVLELARCVAPLRGVVSLHGALNSPLPATPGTMHAKILVLHGDADPLVPSEQVTAFQEEMRIAKGNWEINIYSEAKHGFTGEGVFAGDMPEAAFHPQAESRSWRATLQFLAEVLECEPGEVRRIPPAGEQPVISR